ncbi:hypothetical protein [uncultured Methylobacterium sp.]|uniref:hypothetical protein n=1 Tax=uncultured Methylobacterium sp. TaxID=157278 RepID=UPI0035CA42F9
MTNREMAKGATKVQAGTEPQSNRTPLPPMPAPEDSATPATDREPIDSPQPNPSGGREPPTPEKPGLATKR